MRAITLKRPWPYVILRLGKRVENRPWKPWPVVMGQRIALHAGKGWDPAAEKYLDEDRREWPTAVEREGIVGTAIVEGYARRLSVDLDVEGPVTSAWGTPYSVTQRATEIVNDKFFFGPYGWVLEDVRELLVPIPCSGKQGLWYVPEALLPQLGV